MNLVATGSGRIVEIQGTGEDRAFDRAELDALLDLLELLADRAAAPGGADAGGGDAGLERESRDRGPRALGRSRSLKPEAGRAAKVACGRLN